jgi:multiple sugar transport system substrate-binding protein
VNLRTLGAAALTAGLLATALAGCSQPTGRTEITWYANPDSAPPPGFKGAFGQAGIAERCSTEAYRIDIQQLPGDASQQRIQLARRLAAKDADIDLMSLDPVFTGEFAAAGFLAPIPDDQAKALTRTDLDGAVAGATWDGKVVTSPLWAGTQVLWYRKSVAQRAGLNLSDPVTWDDVVDAAAREDATVGVQANKYEGYAVWINALIQGAGGSIVTNVDRGNQATVELDTTPARQAASVIEKLANSPAAMADLSVSNEGTVLGPFASDRGGFMVNWGFVFRQYAGDPVVSKDLGWARYPRTVADKPSRPPLGGINIGVNAASDNRAEALAALTCITSVRNQARYAVDTGNMPASSEAYKDPALTEKYPNDLLTLIQQSIQDAGPRPITPYWSDISSALQSTWHPARSVTQNTPARSSRFVREVLDGERLL